MTRAQQVLLGAVAAAAALALPGCAPTMIGGTPVGAPSNIDERAAGEQLEDRLIERRIEQRLAERFGNDGRARWNVAAFDRRAVLAGQAWDEATRAEMERTARSVEPLLRSLNNEVTIGPPLPAETRASDAAVAANLRRRLMNDAGARFTSLKVLVENGVAYLVGRVTAQESQIASYIARDTRGVRRVVTHWDIEG